MSPVQVKSKNAISVLRTAFVPLLGIKYTRKDTKCAERVPRSAPMLSFGRALLGSRLIVAPRDLEWPRSVTDRTKTTLCLLSQAYRRFDHPRALSQGDDRAWPALAGGPIGRHRYLEILDAGQVLDDALAVNGPHVDAVQE